MAANAVEVIVRVIGFSSAKTTDAPAHHSAIALAANATHRRLDAHLTRSVTRQVATVYGARRGESSPRKQAHSSRPAHGSIAAGRRFPRKRQEQRKRLQKKRRLAKKVMLRVTHQLIVQGPTEVTLEGLGSELPILEARVPCLHVGLVAARRNLRVRITEAEERVGSGDSLNAFNLIPVCDAHGALVDFHRVLAHAKPPTKRRIRHERTSNPLTRSAGSILHRWGAQPGCDRSAPQRNGEAARAGVRLQR